MVDEHEGKQRVLVVRADRIGDLVISTPVFQAVKAAQPDTEVVALVQDFCLPVLSAGFPIFFEDASRTAIRIINKNSAINAQRKIKINFLPSGFFFSKDYLP